MKQEFTLLPMAALAIALMGCAGEDGADGDAVGILFDGCGCVVAVDLSDFGITDDVIFTGTKYKLDPGFGELLWQVDDGTIWTTGSVEIEKGENGSSGSTPGIPGVFGDGEDGKDRIYEVTLFDGNYGVDEYFGLNESPLNAGTALPNHDL